MFVNYAHRGASTYAPENTMTSFRLGIEMGANGIETDIQETKDGHLVLFHDDSIERCSNGTGRIADYTLEELRALDFGGWKDKRFKGEPIVLFEDFAREFFGLDLVFALELKVRNTEQKVYDIIKKYANIDNIYISSFDFANLEAMSRIAPELKLSWLILTEINEENIAKLLSIGGKQICPKCSKTTAEGVALAASHGLGVRMWGTSDTEIMQKVYPLNTEGMTVNFPDKLTALMKKFPRK